jgi:hypothetical protein
LRASDFSSRTCTDVQARLFDPFFIANQFSMQGAGACSVKLVKRKEGRLVPRAERMLHGVQQCRFQF